MLKLILAISGKPGLYKLVSQSKNMLIVESLDSTKKRLPVHGTEKINSLGDIAIYTVTSEVPLREVFNTIKNNQNGNKIEIDTKSASRDELMAFMESALADFDKERVHISDIKKLISWYNILTENGFTEFEEKQEEEKTEE